MKITYRKIFLKELSKIPSKTRSQMEELVFEELHKVKSIFGIGKIEKMKGYDSYYKIRFGSYRIGLRIFNDTVIFERVLHRKDIYRYFP